jgi:hypothetical protein
MLYKELPVMDKMMMSLISNQIRDLISAFLTCEEGSGKVDRQRKFPKGYSPRYNT